MSPGDEIQIDVRPPARIGRLVKRLLGFIGRARFHPAEPVGDAVHMGVDADVPAAFVGENQHQVRRLAAHARQREELLHGARRSAAEILEQLRAGRLDVARLVAIEAHRIDQLLDLPGAELRHRLRRARLCKQPLGGGVGRGVLRAG